MPFQKELKRLGLKDKEAAVYLACLELGPSPVQQISRKASVVRATTYVVLESLAERGLVTQYKEGKKTLFSAEPPRQLMRLLEKREEEIAERKHDLEQLLPELQMIVKAAGNHPTVKYFEGMEGLRAIRQDMIRSSKSGDIWYNFTPIDHLDSVMKIDQDSYYRQRNAKKIQSKTIFISKSPEEKKKILSAYENKLIEQRYISSADFPTESGMTVFGSRIAIGSFTGKLGGVIIENKPMADMMRSIFKLAWMAAEKLDPTEN